jgi:hypothetical protein
MRWHLGSMVQVASDTGLGNSFCGRILQSL